METPPVLLIDDGELDDVRGLLEDLAVEFLHLRGPNVPDEVEEPLSLLVTTASRALSLRLVQPEEVRKRPMRVAFVAGDSKTQRSLLRRAGFEFLVHSPAHPAAVRLLFLRALYQGRERRGAMRMALGCRVNYRTGLRKKKATLLELSDSGCRLLTFQSLERGTRLTVQLPRSLTRGKPIDLPGRTVRVVRGRGDDDTAEFSVAVRFEQIGGDLEARLNAFLDEYATGPTALPEGMESTPPMIAPRHPVLSEGREGAGAAPEPAHEAGRAIEPEPDDDPGANEPEVDEDGNRRRHARVAYPEEVIAMFREATRVLVGQDLSGGGMRVTPNENLRVGDYLRLGIYGKAGQDPLLVEALVVRNDGPRGVALHFEWMEPSAPQRLEDLIAGLPSIEALQYDKTQPIVLSEIVDRDEAQGDAENASSREEDPSGRGARGERR